jgi:hypothetical protein
MGTGIIEKLAFATRHYTKKPTPVVGVGFSKAMPKLHEMNDLGS